MTTAPFSLFLALTLPVAPPAQIDTAADAAVDLHLNLEPGEATVQTIQIEWANARSTRQVGLRLRTEVLDRPSDAGGIWTAVTGERLWFRTLAGDSPWPDYDSDTSTDPPPAHLPYEGTAFAAALGNTWSVEYGPDGQVVGVADWEEEFEGMIASFRTVEEVTDVDYQQWRGDFPDYLAERVVAHTGLPYPATRVAPGDTWSGRRSSEQGMVDSNFRIVELDEDRVVVEVTGEVRGIGSSGLQSGRCTVDRRTGWPLEVSVEQSGRPATRIDVATLAPWERGGAPATRIGELLDFLDANDKFMGSATVLLDGASVFSRAYGDAGQGRAADRSTRYRIGSITKTFTAVLILQLVEEGRLALSDPLARFFDDLPEGDSITVDHLLRHRSGLGNTTRDPNYVERSRTATDRAAMLDWIRTLPSEFEPDARTGYSNTNYLLLGYIVEELAGTSYAQQLAERIAEPLGLRHTSFGEPSDLPPTRSFIFDGAGWHPEPVSDPSSSGGAGAIVATTDDLAAFIAGLFDGSLLQPQSLDRMTEFMDGLGRGLAPLRFAGLPFVGHDGAIDGFQSLLLFSPEEQLVVSVCLNGRRYPQDEIVDGLIKRALGLEHEQPRFEPFPVSADALAAYRGTYGEPGSDFRVEIDVEDDRLTARPGWRRGPEQYYLLPIGEHEFQIEVLRIGLRFSSSEPGGGFDRLEFGSGSAPTLLHAR